MTPTTPDLAPPLGERARRPPVWFIFSVTVAGILANSALSPLGPTILEHFGRQPSDNGVLVASAALPGVVMAPVIGVLADRFGRRRVLLSCLVVFGVGGLGVAAAWSFLAILGFRVLQGVGGAGLLNLAVVLIADHWAGQDRTRLIGHNSAVLTICLAVVPGVSGLVASNTDWRVSMGFGAFALPVAVVGWKVLPDGGGSTQASVMAQVRASAALARNKRVVAVMASGFVFFVAIFGVFLTVLPVHLDGEFGLDEFERGLVLAAPALGASVVAFNLGRIRAVIPLRTLLIGGGVLIAACALVMGVADAVWLIVVAAVAYGLGDGSVIPSLQDLVTDLGGEDGRASVMALWVSSVRMGQTAGPLAFGWLLESRSSGSVMVVGAAVFAVVAVMFVLGPFASEEAGSTNADSATPEPA